MAGRPRKIHTSEQEEQLRSLCASNLTIKDIAERLGINNSTLRFTIKHLGIKRADHRLKPHIRPKPPVSYKDYLKQKGLRLRWGVAGYYARKMVK